MPGAEASRTGSGALRAYHLLIDAMAVLAAIAALVILVMILGDVTSRQLGFGSWHATIPVVQLMLLYFAVLAAPYLVRERAHVAVDSFINAAGPLLRKIALWAVFALSVASCLAFAVTSIVLLRDSILSGEQVIGGIDLPFWLFMLPLPLAYTLVATEFLRLAVTGGTPYADEMKESL